MSGGVDSSVAAHLLKKQGYDVVGVFIRGYNIDGCQDRDAEDARKVAGKLKIPFYVWNFEKEYKAKVVDYMIDAYRRGLTPNPDVMCNKEIKFGLFFERAMRMGAPACRQAGIYIATGHYVRKSGKTLRVAKDKNKDQSYFLWELTPKQIEKSLFPIGDYLKLEVRKIAKRARLSTAEKKDSQGICFLGQVSIKDFLKKYIPEKRGAVLDSNGKKIGSHVGAHFYTIGQRGGLGDLEHKKGQKDRKPYYVAKKDVEKNVLVMAEGEKNPLLYRKEIELINLNLADSKLHSLIRANTNSRIGVMARVRYRQPVSSAVLSRQGKTFKLVFKKPQKFVAPGQSAVFYSRAGKMLGGGVIL